MYNNDPLRIFIIILCALLLIGAGFFIAKNVSVDCWNWFGLAKSCAVTTVR